MDHYRSIGTLALGFIAVVAAWKIGGLFGIVCLALFATALTVGLKTGSLAPYYPTINREEAPTKFWLAMIVCAIILMGNIVALLWWR
jgi:hypothetical protein